MDYFKPPSDYNWSIVHSLEEILGEGLPVDPKLRSCKIGIYFLLRGKFKEGKNFCTECLTPLPSIPRTHHKSCFNYRDIESYPECDSPLGCCPDCGSEFLHITSCAEMEVSRIYCSDCCYQYDGELCEEDLVIKFLKRRSNDPIK